MDSSYKKIIIPDGGWGWMVVAAVALINMFNQAVLSVFGLLFGEHLKSMNELTTSASLITNLNSLALSFSGFIIGPAIKTFSPRSVAFFGCILTAIGLFACSFSTQLWHIIIGYSLMVGIGLGLITPSTFMAINMYFDKKKGRAVGISMAGTGVGQILIPHTVNKLLEQHGFAVAIRVLSGLSLLGLIGTLALRPLQPIYQNMKEFKLLDGKNEKFEIKIVKSEEVKIIPIPYENKSNYIVKNMFKKLSQAMDLELLMDPIFLSIILGMALVYTSTVNFSMLFPFFLKDSIGLSGKSTAVCMSILACADNVSRILLPFITDKIQCSYRAIFLFGTIGMLIFRSVLAESDDFYTIIILSIFFGIMKSATVLNNNLTISSHCKAEKLPGGLGLNMISKGVIVITLGPLLGWLRDYTESYTLCLHAQNILLLIVVIVWLPELIYRYCRDSKSKLNSEINDSHGIS